jgi:hypothetical protein
VAADARVMTDGLASYDGDSLGERSHEAKVQTKAERGERDALQVCHWTISLLKRWLLGTHAGAVAPKHLQAYLDGFAFRQNRRRTKGVGRIAARVIEQLGRQPLTMRSLIDDTRRCRWFRPCVGSPRFEFSSAERSQLARQFLLLQAAESGRQPAARSIVLSRSSPPPVARAPQPCPSRGIV